MRMERLWSCGVWTVWCMLLPVAMLFTFRPVEMCRAVPRQFGSAPCRKQLSAGCSLDSAVPQAAWRWSKTGHEVRNPCLRGRVKLFRAP